jgi:hypothetical protein
MKKTGTKTLEVHIRNVACIVFMQKMRCSMRGKQSSKFKHRDAKNMLRLMKAYTDIPRPALLTRLLFCPLFAAGAAAPEAAKAAANGGAALLLLLKRGSLTRFTRGVSHRTDESLGIEGAPALGRAARGDVCTDHSPSVYCNSCSDVIVNGIG